MDVAAGPELGWLFIGHGFWFRLYRETTAISFCPPGIE